MLYCVFKIRLDYIPFKLPFFSALKGLGYKGKSINV